MFLLRDPKMINIPELQNAWDLVFTFVAAVLAAIMIIRATTAYKDEDQRRMWSTIIWGTIMVIIVWNVMDIISFMNKLWGMVKG